MSLESLLGSDTKTVQNVPIGTPAMQAPNYSDRNETLEVEALLLSPLKAPKKRSALDAKLAS